MVRRCGVSGDGWLADRELRDSECIAVRDDGGGLAVSGFEASATLGTGGCFFD
jgi:hypothetical protein